jgi:hypothetical protein
MYCMYKIAVASGLVGLLLEARRGSRISTAGLLFSQLTS